MALRSRLRRRRPPFAAPPAPGRIARETAGRGLPIGRIESASYQDESVSLAPGGRLFFDTDGAKEEVDASEAEPGHSQLMAEIDRARELPLREELERLADSVRDLSDCRPGDDVSLLALERVASSPGRGSERGPAGTW